MHIIGLYMIKDNDMTKNRLISMMHEASKSDIPVMVKIVSVDDEGMIHEMQLNIHDIQVMAGNMSIICDR